MYKVVCIEVSTKGVKKLLYLIGLLCDDLLLQ